MSHQSPANKPSTTDQILDLLLDALAERQQARRSQEVAPSLRPVPPQEREEIPPTRPPAPRPVPPQERREAPPARPPAPLPRRTPRPGDEDWQPPPRLPAIHLDRALGRLFILVALLVVLVNIPITRYGVSLARIMPDSASLIIRDGLVLKGSGPEIYVLEDNKLRWISSLEAFEFFGYTWDQVHVVDDEFLQDFEIGRPIHVLLKCQASPHIYVLENGTRRWIKDIPTFEAEGFVWEDVKFVSCDYLRSLPEGPPIPEDAGPAPQP